ncbi:unnamed protein product [Spodoptera exigua]|nr:unnamed protein product [Spodoptera exigua]
METEVVSSFFTKSYQNISERFLDLADELNLSLEQFQLPKKVEVVYNPTIYAREPFEMYVRKYCNTPKPILFFGMNPGPFGMSQTGVPFGEIESVRDWLGITGQVGKPPVEIRGREVLGFQCKKTEASGKKFWGLFKNLCITPENFFRSSFVYNYLPQQWMTRSGSNLTPGECKKAEVEVLYRICDPVFHKVLELYEVEIIVAIGKFCETRAKETIKKYSLTRPVKVFCSNNCSCPKIISYLYMVIKVCIFIFQILYLQHPSPRVVNNNNWVEKTTEFLTDNDLLKYFQQQ